MYLEHAHINNFHWRAGGIGGLNLRLYTNMFDFKNYVYENHVINITVT